MKYLLSSVFLIFFSYSTQAAVGWFYADELRAINDTLQMDKSFSFRGSYLSSLEKTKMGYKINLSGGCTIFLERVSFRRVSGRAMIGPNPEVSLVIDKKKSFCGGQ